MQILCKTVFMDNAFIVIYNKFFFYIILATVRFVTNTDNVRPVRKQFYIFTEFLNRRKEDTAAFPFPLGRIAEQMLLYKPSAAKY